MNVLIEWFFKALLCALIGFLWFFGSSSAEQAILFAVLLFAVLVTRPVSFQNRSERHENLKKKHYHRHRRRDFKHLQAEERRKVKTSLKQMREQTAKKEWMRQKELRDE